jgi:hypothetical protein
MPVLILATYALAATRPAAVFPGSSCPLLAFSVLVSVAGAAAEARAWSRPEACAVAGARSAEAFAAAERVDSGSARADWVPDVRFRDGYSAVPRLGVHCAPVAQRGESSGDDWAQADCLVELAGLAVVRPTDDLAPDGYSVDSAPADCPVARTVYDRSSPAAGRDDSARDGCSVDSPQDDCPVARTVDDRSSPPAGWDGSVPGACSVDSPQDDCLAVTVRAGSVALMADDSVVRDSPRPDVRLERAD